MVLQMSQDNNYVRIKISAYYSLPLGKILILHVMILTKPGFNKDQNRYYYNVFLEKCSYK